MAKNLTEAAVTTRAARAKLSEGLHWRGIDADTHLGYRKGKRGGVWLVRWRVGAGYKQAALGTADDQISEGTLTFADAVQAARLYVEKARRNAKAAAAGPVQTVRTAVDAYARDRDERDRSRKGREVRSDASYRLERYVTGREAYGGRAALVASPIADIPLHDLSEAKLLAWRGALPPTLKGTTRQRLVNDLKAALNSACAAHREKLPHDLSTAIRHGLGAMVAPDSIEPIARESQILTADAIRNLLAAAQRVDAEKQWDGDLYRLVLVLAATGARFSQIVRIRVGDVQPDRKRLLVPASRKGKGARAGTIPFPIGSDVLAALTPAFNSRGPNEILLERWRHEQVAGSIRWQRGERGPWENASEIVRPWNLIRAAAGLGSEVVPYSLRHSSIVQGIRAGLPIRLVASNHDTSVAMIERHYSRWISDGLEDMAAAAVIPLVPTT